LHVKNIRLINFRNYNNISLDFNRKTNVFLGKNAQGKTNLLEAIYICATGRSFRTNRDREIINFAKKEAYVGANANIGDYDKFIEVKMERDRPKRIRINKTELKNYRELYSGLNVIVFSPDDLKLVKEGPQERRNFLDLEISQIKPVYNHNILRYNKILFQRNNLLRLNRFNSDIENLLEVFDLQLANIGTDIVLERKKYIGEINQICKSTHNKISSYRENLELSYISNIDIYDNKLDMEEYYVNMLKKNRKKDIEASSTQLGPHRDDIYISVNDRELKTFGSQGQQRTAVLSIKLSELELIRRQKGFFPVLLLDDVFSELDEERKKYLISFFKDIQTLITTTDTTDLKELDNIEKSVFHIENGSIR